MENSCGLALCGRAGVPEKRALERLTGENAAQLQQSASAVLGMPVLWDDHQEQQWQWSGASLSLEDKLCVLQGVEPLKSQIIGH